MKILYVIPARGGSKGVPKKNAKLLNDKPLISYTLDTVKKIANTSDICVSTDDDEIIKIASDSGIPIPFKRPLNLATDTSSSEDVLRHALDFYKNQGTIYDVVVLLQPTSPFRTEINIKEAIELYRPNLDMIVSVYKTNSNPYYVLFEENSDGYLKPSKKGNFTRRQDCPDVWEYNGAIYVINVSSLRHNDRIHFSKIKKYEMSEEQSLDIDSPLDWTFAEYLLRLNSNK